jgi:hypothetical protein
VQRLLGAAFFDVQRAAGLPGKLGTENGGADGGGLPIPPRCP